MKDDRLAENTLVLAVRVDGQARAYPYDDLAKAPDVVQETLGTTPIVCFYTATPQTGSAFDRRVDGKTLEFTRDKDVPILFMDKDTKSDWTIEGKCVSGPMMDKQLTRVFSLQSQWYGWSAYFPETTVWPTDKLALPPAAKPVP